MANNLNLSNIIEDPETGEAVATDTIGINTIIDFLKSLFTPTVGTSTPPPPNTIADALRMQYDPRRTMLNVPPKPSLPIPAVPPVPGPIGTPPGSTPSPVASSRPMIPPAQLGGPTAPPMVPLAPSTVTGETTAIPSTGAPVLPEEQVAPPFVAPSAPETMDFKAEIQKILSGVPSTTKELIGTEREEIRTKFGQAPWYQKVLAGAFAGMAGSEINTELDRVQKRIDEKFKTDFEMAKAKLGTRVQLETRQLELMMEKDKEKRENYAKLWATLGEANPDYKGNPEFIKMGMRAYGIGEAEIGKFLDSHYNPKTGKYEGLYKPVEQRDWESKKFLINKLAKEIPGHSPDTYFQMAFGNWPDLLKKKEEQLKLEYGTASPERKKQIEQTMADFNKLKDVIPPDAFVEIDRLAKTGGISKDTASNLKRLMMLKYRLGPELAGHVVDIEGRKEIAALSKEAKQPNEAMIKHAGLVAAINDPVSQVIVTMKPGYITSLGTGNKDIVTQYNEDVTYYNSLIDTIKSNVGSKKKTPLKKEDIQSLSNFYATQRRYIRNKLGGNVASYLGAFNDGNVLLADQIIRWAMDGVPSETIIEAIKKIRQK